MNRDIPTLGIAAIVLLLGAGIAWAGSRGGDAIGALPLFALIITIVFIVQIVAFLPACLTQSEHFYDLTGSLTYTSMTALAAALAWLLTARSALLALPVIVWTARLGTFLFRRVRRSDKDSRCSTTSSRHSLSSLRMGGAGTLGDAHGWICMGSGIALIALPVLSGRQLFTLVSLLFVFLLITRVSGIPLLEQHADETWGGQDDYETYKSRTSLLVPLPPKKQP